MYFIAPAHYIGRRSTLLTVSAHVNITHVLLPLRNSRHTFGLNQFTALSDLTCVSQCVSAVAMVMQEIYLLCDV